ncbi:phage terminase large subunit family protein [Sphingomonas sp. BK235]|uniref:phage terminase large subunit family protein n=1 Tax=Sphingomonas sp. BK235 TaxID=2512131 RepID=UPI0010E15BE5|nr:phage terminase large subunit GpA-like protein [Sphingomonas sp. BK235]
MDAVSDPLIEEVVVMKSAQVGWTEIINNIAGYFIDKDPSPIMVMQPTLEMAEGWSTDRLAPMVRDSPRLRVKIAEAKSRDSGNKLLQKRFPGGQLVIVGANSPASLASRPMRVILADEVDRYPASAGVEGDPLTLAYKRTNNFWNRRKLAGSTPTIAGASRIEAKFEESDKRFFFVPCHQCGEHQVLKWEQVRWEKTKAGAHRPDTAHYICEHHGCIWDDADRWGAVLKGEWRATAPFTGIAGFHIWEAYSSWVKLSATVTAFLEARKTPDTYKVWTNTALGLTWVEKGEAPDWQRLYERRSQELTLGEAPEWVARITVGSDVQRDRVEASVWGWGEGMRSVLIEHRVFHGDPSKPDVWKEMDAFLGEEWETPSGRRLRMSKLAIDTGDGHSTTHVYAWARRHPREVMAIKGTGSFNASVPVMGPTWVDVTVRGTKVARGVQLWTIAVSLFKSETYAWLRLEQPLDGEAYPPGYIHLPMGVDAEWLQQLVAEQLITTKNKRTGFTRQEWQKTRERNEAIDCRVYARAAVYALGLDRWSAAKWANAIGTKIRTINAEVPPSEPVAGSKVPPSRPLTKPAPASPKPRKINPLTGKPRGSHFGGRR